MGTLKDKHLIWNSLSTAVVVGLHASAGLRWGSVSVDVPDGDQLKYRLLYTIKDQETSFFLKGPTWVSRLVEVYQDSMSEESGDPVAGRRRGHSSQWSSVDSQVADRASGALGEAGRAGRASGEMSAPAAGMGSVGLGSLAG